jgi:predicted RNase H-like nuclease
MGAKHMKYIGIDGCKIGWFFIELNQSGEGTFGVFERIEELAVHMSSAEMALIDIPIGLRGTCPDERLCDKQARAVLPPKKKPCVFPAPSRCGLEHETYSEASQRNFECTGRRLSKQTFGIVPKIREVDDYLENEQQRHKVREMHPEVAFWGLNDKQAMSFSKKSTEGFDERMRILTQHYPSAEELVDLAMHQYFRNQVARDDIVDALVGAVLARQTKELQQFPQVPEIDDKGVNMEIVYWLP